MQIRLIAVGKIREPYVANACSEFAKRLAPYYPLEIVEVKETGRIVDAAASDELWVLERTGTQLSSEQLAARLTNVVHSGVRRLSLAIGDAFGAGEEVLKRADFLWSLSDLTFLHEWARMIVLEQLYRAAKIQRGEPYHH